MTDEEQDEYMQIEGRDCLEIVTDVNRETIDGYDDWEILVWLKELGYEWNGESWVVRQTADSTQITE